MALRYYVSTYRPPICSNKTCDNYRKVIQIDYDYVQHADIGESWRTFCSCGDGAGWTLNKVEYDRSIQIDEVKIDMLIQLPSTADIPIGDGESKPYWQHDCEKCIWLGSRIVDLMVFDFYYCPTKDSFSGIIRSGNLPEDNESWPSEVIMKWDGGNKDDIGDILYTLIKAHL